MFRFRLERVLRHRQRQVDARSRDVADAERALRSAEEHERDTARQLADLNARAASQRQGPLDVASMRQFETWQDQLHRRLEDRRRARWQAESDLEAAQTQLQAAWRDREILTRLKERQYSDWKQDEARRRQRELDEVGSIRAALGVGGDVSAGRMALAGDRKRQS
jgi:flagellar FliJ protein